MSILSGTWIKSVVGETKHYDDFMVTQEKNGTLEKLDPGETELLQKAVGTSITSSTDAFWKIKAAPPANLGIFAAFQAHITGETAPTTIIKALWDNFIRQKHEEKSRNSGAAHSATRAAALYDPELQAAIANSKRPPNPADAAKELRKQHISNRHSANAGKMLQTEPIRGGAAPVFNGVVLNRGGPDNCCSLAAAFGSYFTDKTGKTLRNLTAATLTRWLGTNIEELPKEEQQAATLAKGYYINFLRDSTTKIGPIYRREDVFDEDKDKFSDEPEFRKKNIKYMHARHLYHEIVTLNPELNALLNDYKSSKPEKIAEKQQCLRTIKTTIQALPAYIELPEFQEYSDEDLTLFIDGLAIATHAILSADDQQTIASYEAKRPVFTAKINKHKGEYKQTLETALSYATAPLDEHAAGLLLEQLLLEDGDKKEFQDYLRDKKHYDITKVFKRYLDTDTNVDGYLEMLRPCNEQYKDFLAAVNETTSSDEKDHKIIQGFEDKVIQNAFIKTMIESPEGSTGKFISHLSFGMVWLASNFALYKDMKTGAGKLREIHSPDGALDGPEMFAVKTKPQWIHDMRDGGFDATKIPSVRIINRRTKDKAHEERFVASALVLGRAPENMFRGEEGSPDREQDPECEFTGLESLNPAQCAKNNADLLTPKGASVYFGPIHKEFLNYSAARFGRGPGEAPPTNIISIDNEDGGHYVQVVQDQRRQDVVESPQPEEGLIDRDLILAMAKSALDPDLTTAPTTQTLQEHIEILKGLLPGHAGAEESKGEDTTDALKELLGALINEYTKYRATLHPSALPGSEDPSPPPASVEGTQIHAEEIIQSATFALEGNNLSELESQIGKVENLLRELSPDHSELPPPEEEEDECKATEETLLADAKKRLRALIDACSQTHTAPELYEQLLKALEEEKKPEYIDKILVEITTELDKLGTEIEARFGTFEEYQKQLSVEELRRMEISPVNFDEINRVLENTIGYSGGEFNHKIKDFIMKKCNIKYNRVATSEMTEFRKSIKDVIGLWTSHQPQ